jgi:hypothetical protein
MPQPVRDRPTFVNEAYWRDLDGPRKFREWLLKTVEGREIHDRWFSSIENHTAGTGCSPTSSNSRFHTETQRNGEPQQFSPCLCVSA